MPFKIRTKLIIAFFAIIFPFITILGVIAIYNINIIRNASLKAEAISEELHMVLSLQLAIDKALMPGNDFIITGDRKYIDEFTNASRDVNDLMKKLEETTVVLKGMDTPEVREETEIFKSVKTSWMNIKEISQKIFLIPNPVGNKEASRLMAEMDYKFAYPTIKMLDKWNEIDRKKHTEATEKAQRAWMIARAIMIGGGVILIAFGIFFALFYSRLFTRPIQDIHTGADAIAKGEFKTRVDIKTGDEFEQLANAMNEMAAQLDSLYSNVEQKVEEKTKELKESEERYRGLLNAIPDVMFRLNKDGMFLDFKGEEGELYVAPDKFLGKKISDVLPQEVVQQATHFMEQAIETGDIQTFEYKLPMPEGIQDYEARLVAIEEEFIVIVRNITERKKAEEKIKEQLDYLERFHKVAVKREFRIKELQDRVKELEKK